MRSSVCGTSTFLLMVASLGVITVTLGCSGKGSEQQASLQTTNSALVEIRAELKSLRESLQTRDPGQTSDQLKTLATTLAQLKTQVDQQTAVLHRRPREADSRAPAGCPGEASTRTRSHDCQ